MIHASFLDLAHTPRCIITIISKHNSIFARQIGRRDPIATLATLIILSYTKLLSTTISILSYADLHYPNGSQVRVWFPDGSVAYFRGKHVPLVLVASPIILTGIHTQFFSFLGSGLFKFESGRSSSGQETLGSMVSSIHTMLHLSPNVVAGLDCC